MLTKFVLKKLLFDSIPLSARTVTRKVEVISKNLKLQLKNKCIDFDYFSLAFDESTDVCDTAQLAIFIRGITGNFDVIEEFAGLIPMKGTTRGEDIAQAILECSLIYQNLFLLLPMAPQLWLALTKVQLLFYKIM